MDQWIPKEREDLFPNLSRKIYRKTSDENEFYNCIAWAVGDTKQWWQPPISPGLSELGWYWPKGAPESIHILSYVKAYEIEGFKVCKSAKLERGYEKVALYSRRDDTPTHAAKLLENGVWSSKLGEFEDISHDTISALEGDIPAYGFVRYYMKRRLPTCQNPNKLKTFLSSLLTSLKRLSKRFSPIPSENQTSS